MLNPALIKKIPQGVRFLYESKMRITNPGIRNALQQTVRDLRRKNKRNSQPDPLAEKKARYGNAGGWAEEMIARSRAVDMARRSSGGTRVTADDFNRHLKALRCR